MRMWLGVYIRPEEISNCQPHRRSDKATDQEPCGLEEVFPKNASTKPDQEQYKRGVPVSIRSDLERRPFRYLPQLLYETRTI